MLTVTDKVLLLLHPLSYIPMFYIKYLTMCKVHMHAGAIRKLLYGCVYVQEIIHLQKLADYLPLHTHKPYNRLILHMYHGLTMFSIQTDYALFKKLI